MNNSILNEVWEIIMGRTIAIGDIHGEINHLNKLLDKLKPQKDDTVIFLGDYIDCGENSKAVINKLIELSKGTNCIFLRGYRLQFRFWRRKRSMAEKKFNSDTSLIMEIIRFVVVGVYGTLIDFAVDGWFTSMVSSRVAGVGTIGAFYQF